jgi:ABC-type lipopolysaccharide export system ATPase subunit
MPKYLTLELTTKNIGPHINLSARLQTSNLEIGIYASNGSGKTFLSRAFRLFTMNNFHPSDANRLLTLGENSGNFKFKITNSQEQGVVRELELNIKRDLQPEIIKNTTGYIFRVFNDDYVKENLEELKYRPDGQIEGYIVGKEKIDLTNEKNELEKLRNDLKENEQNLRKKLGEALEELNNLSIRRNTNEYRDFSFENLINPAYLVNEQTSFDELVNNHNLLKSFPDNLKDLDKVDLVRSTETLKLILNFLEEKFTKSSIAEDFKTKVKSKQEFIEAGINLIGSSKELCPFCEQKLGNEALKLIDQYVEFLAETEAMQIKKSNDLRSQISSERKLYYDAFKLCVKQQNDYLKNKKYLPSLSDTQLTELVNISELDNDYKILFDALEKKKQDIGVSFKSEKIVQAISRIQNWLKNFNDAISKNNQLIELFNTRKNNTAAERLSLNRRLCNAKFKGLKVSERDSIQKLIELISEIQRKEIEIAAKEQSHKILKKEKVIETFKLLLNRLFGKKYTFDESSFCLKFQNTLLESNASDVLSSGEKNIVALCYFIAESHRIIENEGDYEKLFFIIDDPLSSLDFHFVYATSQMIRNLNKLFNISRLRLLLLTHNLEFMSIIIRNRIIEQKYIISNGKLESLGDDIIMPYESHLRDVYSISKKGISPTHTTANSIRHIIETINHFVAPDVTLEVFCERIDGFAENEFLYTLMQDSSHGGIRLEIPYTDEMIKSACDVVINYVTRDFVGQLKKFE